jgi:2-oxoglutarate ferredoxin oxidoreductase subunit alpha
MISNRNKVVELEHAVIRFAGDSGDGMQLTGGLFSDSTAFAGNDFATFPDYPAEIRAPQGTVAGVSGFQIRFGKTDIHTSGDLADVLVAMNPASLKANMRWIANDSIIIVDTDSFIEKNLKKAGYETNPLEDGSLIGHLVVKVPLTTLTRATVRDLNIDNKTSQKSKNMFALGLIFYMFNRDYTKTFSFFETKFKSNPLIVQANKLVLEAGFNFGDTIEAFANTFKIEPAPLQKGKYRNVTGNLATAWGFLAASEKSGRNLFLGSYPITPASEILQELSRHKQFSAVSFQAEDEIAGIVSTIGASFAGALAITTTSGPGFSLKSEAIGLAVITELPIVIVDVQRGGPSTGLPTKSEQSDLMQALFGRNGEAPCIIIAAQSASDCYYSAYEASKLAIEHMTPVILLSDGSIANGSEVFKIPKMKEMQPIETPLVEANDDSYQPYLRDEKKLNRRWALPGTEGLRHRIGGLEKENITGNVSMDPLNHQLMTELREDKVKLVSNYIPKQEVIGGDISDLLVISWGGTYGVLLTAIEKLIEEGKSVSLAHFKYIMPLPRNTKEVLSRYKRILVCEINMGQFVNYLRMQFPEFSYEQFNKVQGLPFMVVEITEKVNEILND